MKLQQDRQFAATQENVSLLLSGYGLKLTGFELAASGIENCTLIIQTTSGKYALRVYRQHKKSDEKVRRELDFIAYLKANGIPVAPPIANNSGDVISYLDQNGHTWQAILMQYMPGSHADRYSGELLINLAKLQATMHNLAASYQTASTQNEKLTELRETHFIQLIQNRQTLDSRRQGFVNRAENYIVHLSDSLPGGLCHLDFDNGNVLSEGNTVTAVLDFDDLAAAPYVMCLAYALWDVAYDLGLGGIAPYLAAYEKLRPLSEHEQRFIKPIMLFRHYVIGCKDIADGQMDEPMLAKYLKLENELLNP